MNFSINHLLIFVFNEYIENGFIGTTLKNNHKAFSPSVFNPQSPPTSLRHLLQILQLHNPSLVYNHRQYIYLPPYEAIILVLNYEVDNLCFFHVFTSQKGVVYFAIMILKQRSLLYDSFMTFNNLF